MRIKQPSSDRCPVPKGVVLVSALLSIAALMYPPAWNAEIKDVARLKGLEAEPSTKSSGSPIICAEGSSFPKEAIKLDRSSVDSFSNSRLDPLKKFTQVKHEKHLMNVAGKEHYTLLHYLTANYGDCRHVVDIGTRFATSALALGATGIKVRTFDRPESTERSVAIQRVGSEEEWQKEVKEAGVNITFHNVNLLTMNYEDFKKYMNTWLIMLDTAHLPDTQPFEREFFRRLLSTGFNGILLLDDIHLNNEMRKWWKEIQNDSKFYGYRTFDLTSIGHATGTGMVDFSGLAEFIL